MPELAKKLIGLKLNVFILSLLLILALPPMVQNADESAAENTQSETEEEEAIEADSDGSLDDTMNSIDVREERDGVGVSADVRVGYFESEIDERDATSRSEDVVGSRWRSRTEYQFDQHLRVVGRVADRCSSEECSADFVLEDSIPTTNGMSDGDITFDEAYLVKRKTFAHQSLSI